ncbi:cation:proton antiporter [Fulvivirga sp. 29W222]|uniref:Cation:proton antiporter n=1 Tax=Fulvivirga marina TaxID=2494733 RepID=A0A937G018_9BACT|nr:monovalent cation:proton antiporter family protein [Fulvivirga marina]MBL6449204.1 cation:proton antiporter [Fulvivirga marina]
MEIPLLQDVIVILGLSVVVILIFQRLKLPTILGFLITGVVAGPHGLSLVEASHEVEILSEIGVILLLFIIGLEFSLKSLAAIKKAVFLGGSFQVFVTIAVASLIAYLMDYSLTKAVFIGFLFSLSSTAIVLNLLQSRSEINSPHGKISLAILIFQDIIVVPMMLLAPILSGRTDDVAFTLLSLALKTLFVIGLVVLAARYIFPRLLYEVAKTRSRELFILTIVVSCLAVAWLTSSIGLSLALGAFIAGLIISESEYSHQATSQVLPFREIFTSFFFVSIGMLLDVSFFYQHLFPILGFTVVVFIIKGLIATLAGAVLKYPPRVSILTGLALFQVGEFAFILSKVGIENGLIDSGTNQYFLSISILSMGITPLVFMASGNIINLFSSTQLSRGLARFNYWNDVGGESEGENAMKDHIVIIGFGINGRNVAAVAKRANIPYVIIEMNAETVKAEKAKGEPILFGDAVSPFILEHVNIWSARVAVIAISDPAASKKIVTAIRDICKTVYIILRTRYETEVEGVLRLGADEVISEEFETSIEIFTRVLNKYLVPEEEIENFVSDIRSDGNQMLRPKGMAAASLHIPNLRISSLSVKQSDNDIVGKTLEESGVRHKYGITLIAIQRDGDFQINITKETQVLQDDIIFIMGTPQAISEFNKHVKI